ncbi:hypothetical protein V6N13_131499 [Hibiscus sabdariffa]|uniref:BURP domain-containing protein n=1 Tax=Hibiscus sabdariffa TaxID=183260 RepID=A0ABR2D8X8_9ROSI
MINVDGAAGPPPNLKYDLPEAETFASQTVHPDVYFLETKLHEGSMIDAGEELTKEANKASFIPLPMAEAIPFSIKNISEILKVFSVQPRSIESQIITEVIHLCDGSPLPRELKKCCTSFECLLDYGVLLMGKKINLPLSFYEWNCHIQGPFERGRWPRGDGYGCMSRGHLVLEPRPYGLSSTESFAWNCANLSLPKDCIRIAKFMADNSGTGHQLNTFPHRKNCILNVRIQASFVAGTEPYYSFFPPAMVQIEEATTLSMANCNGEVEHVDLNSKL